MTAAALTLASRRVPLALAFAPVVDVFTFGQRPGLGVVAGCAILVAGCGYEARPGTRRAGAATAVFCLGALPFCEAAGPLPAAFLASGTILALIIPRARAVTPAHLFHDLWQLLSRSLPEFLRTACHSTRGLSGRVALGPILRRWGATAALCSAFLLLFAIANPILARALQALVSTWPDPSIPRALFWAGAVGVAGAALSHRGAPTPPPIRIGVNPSPAWLAANQITTTLFLFNGLFALQTALDMTYLWGGARLPAAMTYAEYAHRGAFPLLAAALIAGAVTLMAATRGALTGRARWLVLIWIAQTMVLLASAVMRLDLYVSHYSLTVLRLAAFIWMGLVASGLALMAWHILAGQTNRWLLCRLAVLTLAVLYLCAFLNVGHLIASYNVAHARELTGTGQPLDAAYLARLGPQAQAAADAFAAHPNGYPIAAFAPGPAPHWRYADAPGRRNWREWGFRHARLGRYLDARNQAEAETGVPHSDR